MNFSAAGMVRVLVLISILFCVTGKVSAQAGSFSIGGSVVDSSKNEPVELANVALKAPGNEKILADVTADLDGKFILKNVKPGKYELLIAFTGFNTKTLPIAVTGNLKLGMVYLTPDIVIFKAAVIVAQRREITINAEKTVFNVAESPSNQIGTADDVLRNMPGITVDQDGNISILGKSGVKVLVDGRPNAQADNDLPNFLKSLPANSIESIELITNPSAKYDAEGNAGVINIKLKKGKANGLNVSLSAGYGILNRFNGFVNVNYRKNKFNVFTGYSANWSKTGNTVTYRRTTNVNDSTTYYNYHSANTTYRYNNNLKAGFDYFFNDKNTLTYTLAGNYSHANTFGNFNSANLGVDEQPLETYQALNQNIVANYTLNNDLTYVKKFDSTDRELTVEAGHSFVGSQGMSDLYSFAYDSGVSYDSAGSLFQKINSLTSLQNVMVKADYVHPLLKLKGYKIEAGLKNETTVNNSASDDYNLVNNAEVYDTLLSTKFRYVENVSAAYGILRGLYSHWFTYSGGLRIEQTYINGNYNAFKQDYVSFFPNATAGFAFNDTQNLSISYNRRIQRPSFRLINNAIVYSDQFDYWQGNPMLQPSYSNNISVAYSHYIKKHMFVLKAGGTLVNNGFADAYSVDSNRVTRGTEENGINSKSCNLSLYVKLHLTNWWEFQTYYNFTYNYYGFAPGVNLSAVEGGASNLWGLFRFKFWKNTTLDLSGWCKTLNVNPQGTNSPIGTLYASIKKSFLKGDKLTLSLAASDILNTLKWGWTVDNTGIQTVGMSQGTNRYLMITLNYRFGSKDIEERKQQKEENERLTG